MMPIHEAVRYALMFVGLYNWWKADEFAYPRKTYGVALIVLGSLP